MVPKILQDATNFAAANSKTFAKLLMMPSWAAKLLRIMSHNGVRDRTAKCYQSHTEPGYCLATIVPLEVFGHCWNQFYKSLLAFMINDRIYKKQADIVRNRSRRRDVSRSLFVFG